MNDNIFQQTSSSEDSESTSVAKKAITATWRAVKTIAPMAGAASIGAIATVVVGRYR